MARSSGQAASPRTANRGISYREEPGLKISVLLQTYNHERFIGRAIESVLEQDMPLPIEVLVSDDCSKDGTRAVVSEYDARPARRYLSGSKKQRFELDDLLRLCYPPTLSVLFRRDLLVLLPEWAFDVAWTDWLIWIF